MGGVKKIVKNIEKLSQPDVLHSSSDGSHVLLSVSLQSKFIISFLVLMLMAFWTLRLQQEVSEAETVASSQAIWWSCLKMWTAISFLSSTLFTACLCSEILSFSVLSFNLRCIVMVYVSHITHL